MYFCTFTCYNWLSLIEAVNGYDLVYKWFDVLKKKGYDVIGYVIMPNHLHTILYFPEPGYNLNTIIGNAKRFMAYQIIQRLELMKRNELLYYLSSGVSARERRQGKFHKAITD